MHNDNLIVILFNISLVAYNFGYLFNFYVLQIYTSTFVYKYVNMTMYAYKYMHVYNINTHINMYININMHTQCTVYKYVFVYIRMCIYVYVYVYTCTHIHRYMCIWNVGSWTVVSFGYCILFYSLLFVYFRWVPLQFAYRHIPPILFFL